MADFIGAASALSAGGFSTATARVGADPASLWSVVAVETSGCGFLPDKRPKILFERHVFSTLTGRKYDALNPDVSNPVPGGYGAMGANQYVRLGTAITLDRSAALQSASWGLGQIMGENYEASGFSDIDDMVSAMTASEDNQLAAMAALVHSNGWASLLQNRDWAGFARVYNGKKYAQNNYDGKLQDAYAKYSSGGIPDLRVRAAQIYLTYRGFSPGPIDGINGSATQDAVVAFQTAASLAPTGMIDDLLISQLET